MKKEEFVMEVHKEIEKRLGTDYEVKVQTIRKNNNVMLQGLVVMAREKNVSPTIYLDCFYQAYENGTEMEEILEMILKVVREETPKASVDVSFFQDYERVEKKLSYRLVNAEKNEELLSDIPYLPFLDLAICFFYPYHSDEMGNGSILVHNSHMEQWGVSVKELWRAARKNTPELFPAECVPMSSALQEIIERSDREFPKFPQPQEAETGILMYVLSNHQRTYGASVILYDGYMKEIARRLNSDFFILPSSIHEVILLPDTGIGESGQLKNMIRNVNETQVEYQEVLSDSLYYFDRKSGKVKLIR